MTDSKTPKDTEDSPSQEPRVTPPGPVRRKWVRVLLFLFVLLGGGLGVCLWVARPPEGMILRGRPLLAWLKDLAVYEGAAAERARGAIREADPEAVAGIQRALHYRASAPVRLYFRFGQRLPFFLRGLVVRVFKPYEAPQIRRGAAVAVGLVRELPQGCEADLVRALDDEDPIVRERCIESLPRLGREGAREIGRFLMRAEESRCGAALMVLQRMGPEAAPAIPAMLWVVEHGPGQVPSQTSRVLAAQGAKALPVLLDALAGPEDETRGRIRGTLAGALGSEPGAFVLLTNRLPALTGAIRARLPGVLVSVEPPLKRYYNTVAGLLADPEAQVRQAALDALHQRIDLAGMGMQGLLACLDKAVALESRRTAAALLQELDCDAPAVRDVLGRYAADANEDETVRTCLKAAIDR